MKMSGRTDDVQFKHRLYFANLETLIDNIPIKNKITWFTEQPMKET
jgi:hypothetical protein